MRTQWWHMTVAGAAESFGLVPDEDIASGVARPGYTPADPETGSARCWIFPVDAGHPDPEAKMRKLAQQIDDLPYRVIDEADALEGACLGGGVYLVDVVDREPPGTFSAWGAL